MRINSSVPPMAALIVSVTQSKALRIKSLTSQRDLTGHTLTHLEHLNGQPLRGFQMHALKHQLGGQLSLRKNAMTVSMTGASASATGLKGLMITSTILPKAPPNACSVHDAPVFSLCFRLGWFGFLVWVSLGWFGWRGVGAWGRSMCWRRRV